MFIVTARLSRRRILFAAALLLAAALGLYLFFSRGSGGGSDALSAATNEQRVAYLGALGWEVDPDPIETLTLTLPDELAEPYLSYNAVQLRQGFDLEACCGKTLTRYTYAVRNHPDRADGCQADLFLCGSRIVAGDIVCTGADGLIAPLAFPDR